MAGTRPILFGIAVILASGFHLVLEQLGAGYPRNGELAYWGLYSGLVVAFLGLLVGARYDAERDE